MMPIGRGGRWDLHGLCPYPRARGLAVPQQAACCCGSGSGQGSLSSGAAPVCRLASLKCEGCLGPSAGRTVGGGFCTCRRGNPFRLVAPVNALGSYAAPPAWGASGGLGTAAAGGVRRALASSGIQRCPRCCAFVWPHGCAAFPAGAITSVFCSFHPGCRLSYAP